MDQSFYFKLSEHLSDLGYIIQADYILLQVDSSNNLSLIARMSFSCNYISTGQKNSATLMDARNKCYHGYGNRVCVNFIYNKTLLY